MHPQLDWIYYSLCTCSIVSTVSRYRQWKALWCVYFIENCYCAFQMRFSLPSIKCSKGPPSLQLLLNPVRCLNCPQQFDYRGGVLGSSRKWEEPVSMWLTVVKNTFVGWAFNFRVRMLLKGAVMPPKTIESQPTVGESLFFPGISHMWFRLVTKVEITDLSTLVWMVSHALWCPDCINLIQSCFFKTTFVFMANRKAKPVTQTINLDSLMFSFHYFSTTFLCKRVSNQNWLVFQVL